MKMWILPDLNYSYPDLRNYDETVEYVKERFRQLNDLPHADFHVEFDETAAKESVECDLDILGCNCEVPMIELNIALKNVITTRTVTATETKVTAFHDPIDLGDFYKPYL